LIPDLAVLDSKFTPQNNAPIPAVKNMFEHKLDHKGSTPLDIAAKKLKAEIRIKDMVYRKIMLKHGFYPSVKELSKEIVKLYKETTKDIADCSDMEIDYNAINRKITIKTSNRSILYMFTLEGYFSTHSAIIR
jgi:hypothetical protein